MKTIVLALYLVFPLVLLAEQCPKYDRDSFGDWKDLNGDGQDTQAEVLIEENIGTLVFKTDRERSVKSGKWKCPFTGNVYTKVSELIDDDRVYYVDIDHIVPLKEAHLSGGWRWDEDTKIKYANDLDNPDHLMAVSMSANRSKGEDDIAKWPENHSDILDIKWYARIWIKIKNNWGLTADQAELDKLKLILGDEQIVYPVLVPECVEPVPPGPVRKSKSGICHDQSSGWYNRLKNFTEHSSMTECLESGGILRE